MWLRFHKPHFPKDEVVFPVHRDTFKGAKLPHLDTYFSDFFDIQQEAVKIVQRTKPSSKFLQEYLTVFPDLHLNKDKYRECLEPMLMIAQNNGFQVLK